MASWHNRTFGHQKPFTLAMTSAEPYRRIFWSGEWRPEMRGPMLQRRLRKQRAFRSGRWWRMPLRLSLLIKSWN